MVGLAGIRARPSSRSTRPSSPWIAARPPTALDRAAAGNWRTLLERFAEDHAPAYLRRDAATSAALQSLASGGVELGVFTDAPEELARVALAQLGAARRISRLESGAGALERTLAALGPDAAVVRTRNDLLQRP